MIGGQTWKQGNQVSINVVVPLRDDGCWALAIVVKTSKGGLFLEVMSTRPASGLDIRERQESRMNPKFLA